MKRKLIFGGLIVSLFVTCLKENKIIIKQDFEKPQNGWNQEGILKGSAHRGNFYSTSDSIYTYNPSFSKNISEITENKIRRIDLIAWIRKADKEAKADLVLSLDQDQHPVFWKSFSTEGSAPHLNEWTRMYVSYDLPDSIGKNENLKVYFWNKDKLPIDADDLEIRLYY